MSHKLFALGLVSAVLVGCGSDSDSLGAASEYNLSEYEGREVKTDTLEGTWVLAGTGHVEYKNGESSGASNSATKTYFVITEENDRFLMADCESSLAKEIILDDTNISIPSLRFNGTVAGNKLISGKANLFIDDESEPRIESSVVMLKISDNSAPFATVTANVNSEMIKTSLSCYQQYNGVLKFEKLNATVKGINAYPIKMESFKGDAASSNLSYSAEGKSALYFYTDEGDSVNFEINVDSNLSETLNFNGSDGSNSVTGTVVVQLPVQ